MGRVWNASLKPATGSGGIEIKHFLTGWVSGFEKPDPNPTCYHPYKEHTHQSCINPQHISCEGGGSRLLYHSLDLDAPSICS